MLYIAAIPWLHLGKGKWKCQFTSAVTNGTTPLLFAEFATEEQSPKRALSFRLKKLRQKFARTSTTESMEDRLAKRTLWSSLTKSISLGHAKTNAHSKTMRSISCP